MAPPSIDNHAPTEYDPPPAETPGGTILQVVSNNVTYNDDHILSKYIYENAIVSQEARKLLVKPTKAQYEFKTMTKLPRIGLVSRDICANRIVSCLWAGAEIMEAR